MPRSSRLSTQEANRAAMSAADQAGISVDGYVEIARGTGIGDRHRPRCREAVGQIGGFDGKILKREIVCGGNIVDDDVEQAMAPLSRDPKCRDEFLDWKASVRVVSRSGFVDLAHSIGDRYRTIEVQKQRQGPRHNPDQLLCSLRWSGSQVRDLARCP